VGLAKAWYSHDEAVVEKPEESGQRLRNEHPSGSDYE